jgi:uncharacterized protein (TIGR03435 family)
MKRMLLWIIALVALSGSALWAQNIVGDWQGTLNADQPRRLVLRIAKGDNGLSGKAFVFVEQGAVPMMVSPVTLDGSVFKFSIDQMGASYAGTLSADGNSIVGTMTGGPQPQPLTLLRATKETAWEIPAPPPPAKMMAADADPSFDVATIKPNDSGATRMMQLTLNGRNFRTRASSVGDLISFAYEVQMKQIVGAPEWLNKDRYDIDAVPDQEGAASPQQLRIMIQKLLADRFKLTFHHEKRELSAYVFTVGKNGTKLTPTESKSSLPGINSRAGSDGLTLNMANATVGDFTGFLQIMVLDRPVVDRTGVAGRFDYKITFTPDDSQFHGNPPKLPEKTGNVEAAPSLFEAIQQQLGLKVDAEKTPVDVIAIDHVEKPSEN